MKKIVFLILTLLTPILLFSQEEAVDPKAKDILGKAVDAFDSKRGVVADFQIEINDIKSGKSENIPGIVFLKGEKFKLSVRGVDTHFDGKTQSVLMNEEKEVTISTPTKEDLKDINPLILMKSYGTDYKMRYIGPKKEGGELIEVVDLYYNEDLSLAEISEHLNITRQGVRDNIKRAEGILIEMEKSCEDWRCIQGKRR